MSDVLVKKHESLATVKEFMDSLKAMFGQQEWSLRHKAIKYIYTKNIKEETSVREHVLDMMMHFNIAEVNSGTIDEANQRFQNVTMGKEKQVEANVATTKRKFSRGLSFKTKARLSKQKGKCYHCGQNRHWLRNCPKYLAKKKEKKEMQEDEITLKVGTGEIVSAEAVGDLKLYFRDRYIMDVKTTFLNGNLEESIHMAQLEGFIEKGREQKNSKKGLLSYKYGIHLSKEQCPKTPQEVKDMRNISYAFAVGSLMYAMLHTRPDIYYSVGMVSRYQSNPRCDY
ncbi:gag/pol protein [Cucumis melo var. makuwa]|uniref:Gag/pol protein n=1 Tax=Cucumis melo var. makuwa TaxID=1194695 RepID=A0A5D3DI06_CUCMM|nr:gag/pol protein [Cucumis melo var. makuwa]